VSDGSKPLTGLQQNKFMRPTFAESRTEKRPKTVPTLALRTGEYIRSYTACPKVKLAIGVRKMVLI